MEKAKRKSVRTRNIVLAAAVLSILLVTMGTVALAGPAQSTPTSSATDELMMLDPFMLRSITGGQIESLVRLRPIRAPFRPCVRSAFRPAW